MENGVRFQNGYNRKVSEKMITTDGVYICDHCGKDAGEFDEATGNHPVCDELASLRAERDALKAENAAMIEAVRLADNELCEFRRSNPSYGFLLRAHAILRKIHTGRAEHHS